MLRAEALGQQIPVSLQGILQRRGKGILRGQPVGGAEHPGPGLDRQRGSKTLGILQVAAGIAAAMEVQDHARPPLVPRDDPGRLEPGKIMLPDQHLAAVFCLHQLTDLILPLADGLQRAAAQQWLQSCDLGSDDFRG